MDQHNRACLQDLHKWMERVAQSVTSENSISFRRRIFNKYRTKDKVNNMDHVTRENSSDSPFRRKALMQVQTGKNETCRTTILRMPFYLRLHANNVVHTKG